MRRALLGAVLGALGGLALSAPAAAQTVGPIGKQPYAPAGAPACVQMCELVRTVAWTPYPQEACFYSPAGGRVCQPYTQYRSDDRYVRRCFWTCPTRG
jgi:hypothetical protein